MRTHTYAVAKLWGWRWHSFVTEFRRFFLFIQLMPNSNDKKIQFAQRRKKSDIASINPLHNPIDGWRDRERTKCVHRILLIRFFIRFRFFRGILSDFIVSLVALSLCDAHKSLQQKNYQLIALTQRSYFSGPIICIGTQQFEHFLYITHTSRRCVKIDFISFR